MSLMLRKEGQTILDQHKIPNFHVGLNGHNTLEIKSECGKPFVTIQGIRFSNQIPIASEITYAIELLDGFLATHILLIKEYLAAKIAFAKKKEPTQLPKHAVNISFDEYVESDPQGGYIRAEVFSVQYTHGPFIVTHTSKTVHGQKEKKSTRVKFKGSSPTLSGMTKFKQDPKIDAKAIKYLKERVDYRREQRRIEKMKEKLSVCNI